MFILNSNQMQGKIFAIALIILGFYILSNVLFDRGDSQHKNKHAEIYHIGCYDIDRPLTHSQSAETYLAQLTAQFNQTSTAKIASISTRIQQAVFAGAGGNEIARQFQRYITTYQNIKSRNQYQQSFYSTLRQTRDEFLQCRERFNEKPWDCREVARAYNSTDAQFNQLKGRMAGLMARRGEHLNRTEELLKDEDVTKDIEFTEQYTREIDLLNEMISKKHHRIKEVNETLMIVENDIYKYEDQLQQTRRLLNDCSKNKEEIDFCKNISDYVQGLYEEINLEEIERSMKKKRMIIDLLKSHLVQSKKLGENVIVIEKELQKEKEELRQEEILYYETNNTGKCGMELQFRCSPDNVIELQNNITSISALLVALQQQRQDLATKLNKDVYEKQQFQSKISLLSEELKNNAVDVEHLKVKEERKRQQLQQYRDTLNEIIISIAGVSKEISQLKLERQHQSKDIDKLMGRGEELIECLGKKELFLKLDSRRPKHPKQDAILKREASQSLTDVLKRLLKQ